MAGVKGQSGGARQGSGRLKRRFFLSKEASQELAIITGYEQGQEPEHVLEQWIHEHWLALDAIIQANATQAG